MTEQVSIGLVLAVLTPLTGAVGVLFWALVGALQSRAKRAEDQVDTLLPALDKLNDTVKEMAVALRTQPGR